VDANPVMPGPAAIEEPARRLGGNVGRRHQRPLLARLNWNEYLAGLRDHVCGKEEVFHKDPGAKRDDRRKLRLKFVLNLSRRADGPRAGTSVGAHT